MWNKRTGETQGGRLDLGKLLQSSEPGTEQKCAW